MRAAGKSGTSALEDIAVCGTVTETPPVLCQIGRRVILLPLHSKSLRFTHIQFEDIGQSTIKGMKGQSRMLENYTQTDRHGGVSLWV